MCCISLISIPQASFGQRYAAQPSKANAIEDASLLGGTSCDMDGDGDVDGEDVADVIDCLSGPGIPPAAGCGAADVNGDGSVDMADFAICQAEFTGAMLLQ